MMKERIEVGAFKSPGNGRFVARSSGTSFNILATDNLTEIEIYDEISPWGVTSKDFRARLKDASGRVKLRINSPGGVVTEGIGIYNDLVDYKYGVDVIVTGVAASMASIIAMAGDTISISENAFFMIHNPWGMAVGDEREMTSTAEVLRKMGESMARTYASRTGTGIRAIKDMMAAETWMTAKEAVEAGFADKIEGKSDARARFDMSIFGNAPQQLQALSWDDDSAETETDIEKLLMRDAGPRTRSQARGLIKDIRAGKTSTSETMLGAGGVQLDSLAAAIQAARQTFSNHR
jgi:ATP-dependent Clp protease, protease subunit